MNPQLLKPVNSLWQHHLGILDDALDESIRGLRNLLRLDEYHRHGREVDHLKKALGPFGSTTMNLSSLSEVLGTSSRTMTEDRRERIENLLRELSRLREICLEKPLSIPSAQLDQDAEEIFREAEAHLNRMAQIFASLRIAQLEIRSKFEAREHDPFFQAFDWRQLNPTELSLCPPYIVHAPIDERHRPALLKIISLLESGKPLKIIATRTSLRKSASPYPDPGVPASLSLEMLPVAMRAVYFLQTSPALETFEDQLFKALTSPRATLVSLLLPKEHENPEAFEMRTERALQARAFPAFSYNPDRADGFVSRFQVFPHPDPGDLDFARFALNENEFRPDFSDPLPGSNPQDLIPVNEYLALNRRQRTGKFPCLFIEDPDGPRRAQVLSPSLMTQIADLRHLWKTLQELAGMDNPHVRQSREALKSEMDAQKAALLEDQQRELEADQKHREEVAVAVAVKRIVSTFTGINPASIDLQSMLAKQPSTGNGSGEAASSVNP